MHVGFKYFMGGSHQFVHSFVLPQIFQIIPLLIAHLARVFLITL